MATDNFDWVPIKQEGASLVYDVGSHATMDQDIALRAAEFRVVEKPLYWSDDNTDWQVHDSPTSMVTFSPERQATCTICGLAQKSKSWRDFYLWGHKFEENHLQIFAYCPRCRLERLAPTFDIGEDEEEEIAIWCQWNPMLPVAAHKWDFTDYDAIAMQVTADDNRLPTSGVDVSDDGEEG